MMGAKESTLQRKGILMAKTETATFDFQARKVSAIPVATRANRTSKYDAAWEAASAGGVVQFGPLDSNIAGALRTRLLQLAEKNKVNLKVVTRPGGDGQRMVYAEVVTEVATDSK